MTTTEKRCPWSSCYVLFWFCCDCTRLEFTRKKYNTITNVTLALVLSLHNDGGLLRHHYSVPLHHQRCRPQQSIRQSFYSKQRSNRRTTWFFTAKYKSWNNQIIIPCILLPIGILASSSKNSRSSTYRRQRILEKGLETFKSLFVA